MILSQEMQEVLIAPEHADWKVGSEGIEVKDLCLASLDRVSIGSWQPRLFYRPPVDDCSASTSREQSILV